MIQECVNKRRTRDKASYLSILRTNEVQDEADIKGNERLNVTTQAVEGLSNGLMADEIQDEVKNKIKQETTRLTVENMVSKCNCQ